MGNVLSIWWVQRFSTVTACGGKDAESGFQVNVGIADLEYENPLALSRLDQTTFRNLGMTSQVNGLERLWL